MTSSTTTPRGCSRSGRRRSAHPRAGFTFQWGEGAGHGWMPMSPPDLISEMAAYMAEQAPDGTDTSGWIVEAK